MFIGEATVATIAGLILGPHCLNWFRPLTWGNSDNITLEISRILLCIQIVAVAVELPRKYMKKHWVSVAIFLLPVMTIGWLVVGLFIWCLIPHFDFPAALLVSACVTATDPILAAAVVGKGKFAERVPGHLRNLLSAESGCNDGMAFPFIFLSMNLVLYPGQHAKIAQDWFTLTIFWECACGCIFGFVLGFVMRKAVFFAEKKNLIDRESFLAIFVFLAFNSAGIGSLLGVDDLLMSFAAGTTFGWNGEFARKTEETHVSTVIDLLLNLAYFVYFGAIIPWPLFNDALIGLNCWRLIILAIVVIFLRRLPAVVALKPITPDVKTWREAFFCGHFGPIGVGAIFAAILARSDLEEHYLHRITALDEAPDPTTPHYQLIVTIWPIVCFVVIVSIIVHGSSVAVLTLGKRLNSMAITMSYTATNNADTGPTWMSRLKKLDRNNSSFSLHRVDTRGVILDHKESDASNLTNSESLHQSASQDIHIETSGTKVRPAGGAMRRKRKMHKRQHRGSAGGRIKQTLSRLNDDDDRHDSDVVSPDRRRPQTEFLQLGRSVSREVEPHVESAPEEDPDHLENVFSDDAHRIERTNALVTDDDESAAESEQGSEPKRIPTAVYEEGSKIFVEDQEGEIMEEFSVHDDEKKRAHSNLLLRLVRHGSEPNSNDDSDEDLSDEEISIHSDANPPSIHSIGSFRRRISQYSEAPPDQASGPERVLSSDSRKQYYSKKDSPHRKVFVHQIDDLIVVENEDGDIIRRYKVQRHRRPTVSLAPSKVSRALSYMGLKRKETQPDETALPDGQVPTEEPQEFKTAILRQDTKVPDPVRDDAVMANVEKKIADMVDSADSKNKKKVNMVLKVETPLDESRAERNRRLAALGQSVRTHEDEEHA